MTADEPVFPLEYRPVWGFQERKTLGLCVRLAVMVLALAGAAGLIALLTRGDPWPAVEITLLALAGLDALGVLLLANLLLAWRFWQITTKAHFWQQTWTDLNDPGTIEYAAMVLRKRGGQVRSMPGSYGKTEVRFTDLRAERKTSHRKRNRRRVWAVDPGTVIEVRRDPGHYWALEEAVRAHKIKTPG